VTRRIPPVCNPGRKTTANNNTSGECGGYLGNGGPGEGCCAPR
jgi:hypothetical protein